MTNVIGENRKVVRYLRSLAEFDDDWQTSAGSRIFAKTEGIIDVDGVYDGLVDKTNRWIDMKVSGQTSGDDH